MPEKFLQHLETGSPSPAEIESRLKTIHRAVREESRCLDASNFTQFHPGDLELLFQLYDDLFFAGHFRQLLKSTPLQFRISSRMTSAGGKTTRFIRRGKPTDRSYEITVSSTLLFETFRDVRRPINVTGLECRDRLEALQRIFEHEMVHLLEMLLWNDSSCSARRFQSIAHQFFGHTDHRHALVTPRERASKQLGLKPGCHVRFTLEGVEYRGIVNRITRRATVLVEDRRGQRYSNGRCYSKFYVPLEMLQLIR